MGVRGQPIYTNKPSVFFNPPMLSIRPATIDDAELLRTFIRELAEFEHELHLCVIEAADLADGFGPDPKFRALMRRVGWVACGVRSIFWTLLDLGGAEIIPGGSVCVREVFRGRGIGKALLTSVARIAVQENCCSLTSCCVFAASSILFLRVSRRLYPERRDSL